MKNWKTALFGLIMAMGSAVQSGAAGTPNDMWVKIANAMQVGGMLGLGFQAKDKDVTGAGPAATRVSSDGSKS